MNPPANKSFREVLQDLLQPHVMFCYLQAIEHNSAEGKKQDVGMAISCTAETWMSVACHWELGSAAHVTQVQ